MATGISGLASGFDSDAYITATMNQEKIPLTNLQTKQSKLTAYKTAFTTLNTKMATLRDAATALKDVTNFQALTATSSDTTKMTVTAGTATTSGTYSVNVSSLATAQVSAIQGFTASSTTLGNNLPTKITINNTDVDLSGITATNTNDWLSQVTQAINKQTGLGVTAAVVQTSSTEKALTLTANKAGLDNKFTVTTNSANYTSSDIQTANNAVLTVNGLAVTSSTNTVDGAIPGVTLNLTGTGASTIKVAQNTTAITDKIDAFVKAYNDIVTSIRNSTAKPDDSSSSSSSSNTLTLQGDSLLRDLQSQLNGMMNTVVGDTPGFKLLSDIGLEVDKGATTASAMTGTLTFDKDAFNAKLAENPDAVKKILTGGGQATPIGGTTSTYDGFGAMFESRIKVYTDSVDGLITSKIKGYSDDINFIGDQITDMQNRLDIKEASLKATYANLEVVMSSLNNTSSWLTSQFASLTKSKD
jgi:flagellar hook-associated protein 2